MRRMLQQVKWSLVRGDINLSMGGLDGPDEQRVLDRAAAQLRKDVLVKVRLTVARMRLEQPATIEVPWRGCSRPLQPAAQVLGVDPLQLVGTVSEIAKALRGLPRHQMVALGNPGTGKTILAVRLVHDMADHPEPGDPVPVLMSLSSWRPAVPMREWILRQIRQASPHLTDHQRFGTDAAADLFDACRVMPVLDGLDELPDQLHSDAVRAIDAAIHRGCWLLVTCRATEYETAHETGAHLTRAAVVELDEVKAELAIGYLEQAKVASDSRWAPVFEAMRRDPDCALSRTLTSPLMLYLAQTAYDANSTDPGELLSQEAYPSREAIEDGLLKRYLPAVYTKDPPSRYPAELAMRYLGLIARQMRRDRTVDFAWWQINARIAGPLVGLMYGAVWGALLYALFGPAIGVVTGLFTAAMSFAAHQFVRADLKQVFVPKEGVHGPGHLARHYARVGAASALLAGAVTGVSVGLWLSDALGADLPLSAFYGAVVGVLSGCAVMLGSASGSYEISRCWFWLTGRLPRKPLLFLDEARELGVLRQTGAVHQFRHERLLSQLGGDTAQAPGRSVHGKWAAKWLRWRPVLPAFASLAQVGASLFALLFIAAALSNGMRLELTYRSGDRPAPVLASPGCPAGVGCRPPTIWMWKVPLGSTRHTDWMPTLSRQSPFTGWGGFFKASGCEGGRVQVTLTLAGEPPARFTLGNDSEVGPGIDLDRPASPGSRPSSLTLRRLDDRPCSLRVEWESPSLVVDGLQIARDRLGIALSPTGEGNSAAPGTAGTTATADSDSTPVRAVLPTAGSEGPPSCPEGRFPPPCRPGPSAR
ncbi:NACHT domain-containing protein [Streptomyces bluensis]|uniref:NACHT domain-containing protein n=1 Tax=Streptomyces bluensis TaxID=33897 RepID=A0ABW6UVE6_9ACTN